MKECCVYNHHHHHQPPPTTTNHHSLQPASTCACRGGAEQSERGGASAAAGEGGCGSGCHVGPLRDQLPHLWPPSPHWLCPFHASPSLLPMRSFLIPSHASVFPWSFCGVFVEFPWIFRGVFVEFPWSFRGVFVHPVFLHIRPGIAVYNVCQLWTCGAMSAELTMLCLAVLKATLFAEVMRSRMAGKLARASMGNTLSRRIRPHLCLPCFFPRTSLSAVPSSACVLQCARE